MPSPSQPSTSFLSSAYLRVLCIENSPQICAFSAFPFEKSSFPFWKSISGIHLSLASSRKLTAINLLGTKALNMAHRVILYSSSLSFSPLSTLSHAFIVSFDISWQSEIVKEPSLSDHYGRKSSSIVPRTSLPSLRTNTPASSKNRKMSGWRRSNSRLMTCKEKQTHSHRPRTNNTKQRGGQTTSTTCVTPTVSGAQNGDIRLRPMEHSLARVLHHAANPIYRMRPYKKFRQVLLLRLL